MDDPLKKMGVAILMFLERNQLTHMMMSLPVFFSTLVKFDGRHRVYDAVWQHQNGVPGYEDWEHKLERGRLAINHALREHDTVRILSILFDRLYVLRNQLVHLGCLLPIFVDLMMDNPSMNGRCRTIRWWTDPTRCNCGRIHSAASRYP